MEIAGLILGITGTATGVGALAWEVITWRRSGPVVSVDVLQGLPTYGDHVGDPVTCVTATNSGRAPVTVTSWGLELPDGQTMFVQDPFPGSDALPYRLEEGASGPARLKAWTMAICAASCAWAMERPSTHSEGESSLGPGFPGSRMPSSHGDLRIKAGLPPQTPRGERERARR
jgi:hypothetical protein